MARDRVAGGQVALPAVEHELHDGHRRDRGLVVRIEHAQQGVGDLGEVVVQLVRVRALR